MLHQIGAGALGPVFRAYQPERDRLVAIKLFRFDLPPERVHQLVAELERLITSGLTHPGIAAPLAAGIDGNAAYLVQEFIAADSLDVLVRDFGSAPAAGVIQVTVQLAGALDFAAAADATHGALHPRDVLMSSDTPHLTGIGVVRALERVGVAAPVRRPYTAPERIAGGAWDRRADVFSLGAVVYEMLWGRRVQGAGRRAAATLAELPGAEMTALRAAFERVLAEDPAERFATALEFAAALKAAFPGVEAPPPAVDADIDLRALDALALESERFRDVEAVPDATESRAPIKEPLPSPVDARPSTIDARPSTVDARLEFSGLSTVDSHSAMWPLALALGVGIALGFGLGYAVGNRDRTTTALVAPPASERPAVRPSDFTESAVPGPPKPAPIQTPPPTPADAAREPTTQPAITGRLLVRSTPAGARVFVDGRDRGRTPATVRDLARGAHRVRVVREGYATEERRVVVTDARPALSMDVPLVRTRGPEPPVRTAGESFVGSLSVDSRPPGARVFVDGKLAGTTPMELPKIAAGEHAVRLEHNGYRLWSSSVRIVPGERNRVTASLEK